MSSKLIDNVVHAFQDVNISDILDALRSRREASFAERAVPFMIAFSAGLAVGAAAALLLTPKTGVELRHTIEHQLEALRTKATAGRGPDKDAAARTVPVS